MTDHRHPRCVRPVVAALPPSAGISDLALIQQLNGQVIEVNAKLESAHSRIRDLERQLAQLMCWGLIPFADGELDDERAGAFRAHLGTCEDCQRSLVDLQQIDASLSSLSTLGKERGNV